MALADSATGYGWLSRALHWTVALLVLGLLSVGTWMANFEQDLILRLELTQTHKSFGFTVFVLSLLRIGWRLSMRGRPAPVPGLPGWQLRLARVSHLALYALTLAMPLSGWLMASASPFNDADAVPFRIPNAVFGLFEMPDPFPRGSEALSETYGAVHATLGLALAGLLALHAGAALWHHFGARDAVLSRMIRG